MKPYFAAETDAFDVDVDVVDTSGPTNLSSFTLNVTSDLYAISDIIAGATTGEERSVFRLLCEEVTNNTADLNLNFFPGIGNDENLCGFDGAFYFGGTEASGDIEVQFSGANADRARALFGFTSDISVTDQGGGLFPYRAFLQRQPSLTWFPKSHMTSVDDWVPHPRDIFHSELTGDGSSVGVVQDDGVLRYWRRWLISAVPGARVTSRRASNSERDWYETAGLSSVTNAAEIALDWYDSADDHGWWYATASGNKRFVCVEDETASEPEFSRYRFNFRDPRAPVDMSGWLGLVSPNVSRYSDAAGRRDISFCAFEDPISE